MARAFIISVGDELLSGRTPDTNATWLSRELRGIGFPVVGRETVGDDREAIAQALGRGAQVADVVIVSGGLGPTADDLTRHGLAAALDVRCELHEGAVAQIRAMFEAAGRELSPANLEQANLPVGSTPLHNAVGSAPGIRADLDGALLLLLPGVPRELKEMTHQQVIPLLREHPACGEVFVRESVTVAGVPESEAGRILEDLMQRGRDPSVGSYPGVAHLVLVVEGSDATAVAADVAEIRARLADAVVCVGERTLHEVVVGALMATGTTVAVAESLTGGRIADLLVSVPGASSVFRAGFATYANEMKADVLGVRPETLDVHGAVSELCAREMAEGARRVAGADIALATTGIAGPTGAVPGKPVGTVFVALASEDGTDVRRLRLVGDRVQIRERAAAAALDLLRKWLCRTGFEAG
ncbi:MAG: CinA family nicotinamide mononucleotide deamidase-related protein [Planctomycetota bacterium]|nr:CinA family nicotinamide mononucleotide deamidase-related protein [Planctomycetota bacterium]